MSDFSKVGRFVDISNGLAELRQAALMLNEAAASFCEYEEGMDKPLAGSISLVVGGLQQSTEQIADLISELTMRSV